LYPQMLVGGSGKNVDEAFRFWLLFSVPITLGICSLAPAFAYVLRKEYAVAYLVIILRTLASFFVTFGDIMVYAASGHEKLSPESGSSGKPLASSSTLKMVVVKLVSGLLYLGVIFLVLHSTTLGDVGSAILVALTYALVSVMSLIPLYSIARSLLRFRLPMESLARYALYFVPSLVLIWVFYPTGAFSERILDVLINLFPIILASAVLYFSVALALDPYFRQMVQSFISRLTRRKQHSSGYESQRSVR